MDFLKEVKKYHEKKLNESLIKMRFHLDMKRELEQKMKKINNEKAKKKIQDKIIHHDKMINIWKNNLDKINEQLKKIRKE